MPLQPTASGTDARDEENRPSPANANADSPTLQPSPPSEPLSVGNPRSPHRGAESSCESDGGVSGCESDASEGRAARRLARVKKGLSLQNRHSLDVPSDSHPDPDSVLVAETTKQNNNARRSARKRASFVNAARMYENKYVNGPATSDTNKQNDATADTESPSTKFPPISSKNPSSTKSPGQRASTKEAADLNESAKILKDTAASVESKPDDAQSPRPPVSDAQSPRPPVSDAQSPRSHVTGPIGVGVQNMSTSALAQEKNRRKEMRAHISGRMLRKSLMAPSSVMSGCDTEMDGHTGFSEISNVSGFDTEMDDLMDDIENEPNVEDLLEDELFDGALERDDPVAKLSRSLGPSRVPSPEP